MRFALIHQPCHWNSSCGPILIYPYGIVKDYSILIPQTQFNCRAKSQADDYHINLSEMSLQQWHQLCAVTFWWMQNISLFLNLYLILHVNSILDRNEVMSIMSEFTALTLLPKSYQYYSELSIIDILHKTEHESCILTIIDAYTNLPLSTLFIYEHDSTIFNGMALG